MHTYTRPSLSARLLALVAAVGLLTGCSSQQEPNSFLLLNTDFEEFDSWGLPQPAFISTDQAHSGRFSCGVSQGVEYGFAYHTTLGKGGFVPSRLRLQGWTYLTSGLIRSTLVVVEVRCHGRRPAIWQGLNIDGVVRRYQKWEPITKTIDLPADLDPTDEVWVSVWCPERGAAKYFDDMTLEALR